MSKTIPYSTQFIDNQDIKAVVKVLKSGWITQGPKILEFEKAVAKYVGAKFAVAVCNGTAGLHAACLAIGIRAGDEVIVPTLTFIASANCVLYCGAKPVLVDVCDDDLTINIEEAEKKISKKTKAIIAVDFAGHPANWDRLEKLAKKYKLFLIDDAAHAIGSTYRGKKIGSIANLTVFSFHPVKTITTAEGGIITTNDKRLYEKLLSIRNHGIIKDEKMTRRYGGWYYEVSDLGYNFRITDIQAALGLSQLRKIKKFIKERRSLWRNYYKLLKNIKGLRLPIEKKGVFAAWHLFPIRINREIFGADRRKIYDLFLKSNIKCQVHYMPIHLHPLYKIRFGYGEGDFPVAEKYYQEAMSFPLFPSLKASEQKYVIGKITEIIKKNV